LTRPGRVARGGPHYENAAARVEVVSGQTDQCGHHDDAAGPGSQDRGPGDRGFGKPVVATIRLAGPQIAEAKTDDAGNLSVAVQPGQYALRVEAASI